MFSRKMTPLLLQAASKLPVIAILGPRQSGKTTLAKSTFSGHVYVSLENYDERELAITDPQRFLKSNENEHGIIIDEVQHAPKLLSYIQTYVDQEHKPGYIVITGSQNILLNQSISQTLAGRIALFTLLPLSIGELKANTLLPKTVDILTFKGCYPRIYAYDIEPTGWYLDYSETYIERDVRQIINVVDLSIFKRFIRLCAARTGQLLNIHSLAIDCSIDLRTAKAWLSVLEASYIIFFLQPHYKNFNKKLIKTPKLYFYDTGLACALLGIKSQEQFDTHYLRGSLIESLLIADIRKHYYNIAQRPDQVYFWRDQTNEVDCIIEHVSDLIPIEIKASTTIVSDFFTGLNYWADITQHIYPKGYVIYGGFKNQERAQGTAVSWQDIDTILP